MKITKLLAFLVVLLLLSTALVSAMTASEAKQEWKDKKQVSLELQKTHREAKAKWAGDKSPGNDKEVVDTGKEVLDGALDEVEAWLEWKRLEARENDEVPADIKENIENDVDANMAKIGELRGDVDSIENQLGLGLVFLKMIGKYTELLADVARNSGDMWAYMSRNRVQTIEEYEMKLRESAGDNEDVIAKLDMAREELQKAEGHVDEADGSYGMVKIPGQPLIKFAEGNTHLRAARLNMLSAHGYLNEAYALMLRGE